MTQRVLLPAVDRRAQPWKDGGGTTRQVAAFPATAGLDDFAWRVSMAEVASRGPFSRFADVDRVLIVLEGLLELEFGQAEKVILGPGDHHAFSGDARVMGTPIGGPVHDLNVMVRRGVWTVHVTQDPPPAIAGICVAIATQRGAGIEPLDAMLVDDPAEIPQDFTGYFIQLARA
jgi:environmental stress-induced protein Ves